jgi:hypothetical protein
VNKGDSAYGAQAASEVIALAAAHETAKSSSSSSAARTPASWYSRSTAIANDADDRLRCPCHSASFSPTGQVLAHQLPIAPTPLPQLEVREVNGAIEVFAPAEPTQPA